jgi:hypothetical protein
LDQTEKACQGQTLWPYIAFSLATRKTSFITLTPWDEMVQRRLRRVGLLQPLLSGRLLPDPGGAASAQRVERRRSSGEVGFFAGNRADAHQRGRHLLHLRWISKKNECDL